MRGAARHILFCANSHQMGRVLLGKILNNFNELPALVGKITKKVGPPSANTIIFFQFLNSVVDILDSPLYVPTLDSNCRDFKIVYSKLEEKIVS